MVGVVETAHEEGIQKGIQQGIQQGIEQGRRSEKLTIAQTMKQAGISLDLIAQVTGLWMEELQTLE